MNFMNTFLRSLMCCMLMLRLQVRVECTLLFPIGGSGYGIFVGIAVPLDLPNRGVFLSYNFEANFNFPFEWNIPPALIFAAIAVPLDLPHRNVFISYNFEANYNMPANWGIPPVLILAAIAVPLDLPHRNVYFSYNFEANYNLPNTWDIPPYANGIQDDDDWLVSERKLHDCKNCTATEISTSADTTTESSTTTTKRTPKTPSKAEIRERRSLLSRKHFYQILTHKFERSGFQGESCLLRLICETNASGLGDINGVLGSLIHVLFAPTTSMDEHLPLKYYQAEIDGAEDQCEHYATECTTNIIDFISQPLHEIISTLTNNK